MTALVLATLAREVPAPADTTGAPQWVHLLPSGDIQGRDGRSYSLTDPAALVADFEAGALDLVVDFEHASENPARRLSGPVPAAGWIRQLQARADGIWGCVEWTAQAADLITAKAYRYLSPVILHHPDTHEIMRLKGAGLVHAPNLMLQSLNAQEAPMTAAPTSPATPQAMAQFANMIAHLLGLPPDTPPDELLAKIKAKLIAPPDPSKFMAVSAVQEMLADRLQERGKMVEGRAQEKVRVAVQSGYIANGMRGWALDLCRSDEAAFDDFLTKAGPTFAHLSRPVARVTPARGEVAMQRQSESDFEAAVCAQLGLKPGSLSK